MLWEILIKLLLWLILKLEEAAKFIGKEQGTKNLISQV